MTAKQKAEIKKVLIELGSSAHEAGETKSVPVTLVPAFILSYLERIVAIVEGE